MILVKIFNYLFILDIEFKTLESIKFLVIIKKAETKMFRLLKIPLLYLITFH